MACITLVACAVTFFAFTAHAQIAPPVNCADMPDGRRCSRAITADAPSKATPDATFPIISPATREPPLPTEFWNGDEHWHIFTAHPLRVFGNYSGYTCDKAAIKYGECAAREKHWLLLDPQKPRTVRRTLFHELEHVVIGTEHTHERKTVHDFIEMSEPLVDLLADPRNKALREYLFAVQ